MLFYFAKATILEPKSFMNKDTLKEFANMTKAKNTSFFYKHNKKVYICIVSIQKNLLSLFMTLDNLYVKDNINEFITSLLSEYTELLDIRYDKFDFHEITFITFSNLVYFSWCNEFTKDYDETIRMLKLYDVNPRDFDESIITKKTESEIVSDAKNLMFSDTLLLEIKRIYQGTKKPACYGHPVHYVVQTDDKERQSKVTEILLSALYANNRVQSSRYSTLLCSSEYSRLKDYESIYESNRGGTIVINYEAEKEVSDNHVYPDTELIDRLSKIINKYKNDVLTILILPFLSSDKKDSFIERLGSMTFVPLQEEIIYGTKAKRFLKLMALNAGVKPDSRLLNSSYNSERAYCTSELNHEFDRWYSNKLKSNIYPQYAKFDESESITKKIIRRGEAYTRLNALIGLDEAKKVINQALDFYKAQLLFKSKGINTDSIAIHMAFTGNPGTAKTTVARLFAQILKDNGYLPIGNLIEVGRADLVGKYVGWTAPIVKAKFEAAKGSVLLIDEAYSLIDGESGLYGDEAINTIVQEMENHRKDTIVIFAGYPDKMEQFLNKNPGLKSRIAFHIPFNDYTPEELFKILELMISDSKMILSKEVKDKILKIFEKVYQQENFGNGRYVRNMFEKAKQRQASRLIHMNIESVTRDDVQTLLPEDFEEEMNTLPLKSIIGF